MKAISRRSNTLFIDIAGGVVFGAMLIASVCIAVVGSGKASRRISGMRNDIQSTEAALRTAQTELIQLEQDLAERQGGMAADATLPSAQSTEGFFQRLSSLAGAHELRVLRQSPLGVQRYPGIVERQFAFELAGSVPDLASFLRAFEARSDWADIAYIDVGGVVTGSDAGRGDRTASLTVSLYAAAETDAADSGEADRQAGAAGSGT